MVKPGEWITGAGWDEGKLAERRYPTAADLDAVAPDNPVWLMHTTGHYGVANSFAMKLAGVTTSTPDPPWDAYKALLDTGQLKERICVLWDAGITLASARHALDEINSVPRLPATLGDGRLLSCGVKLFMDGSGGARTGWVWEPWMIGGKASDTRDGNPNTGYPHMDPDTYREMVLLFQKSGVPVGTHAVGDRAMDWVVDSYALAEKRYPHPGLRHAIIHYSVTPVAARYGLWASVARQTSAGIEPFGAAESVDGHAALRSYTAWGARRMFLEDKIGTLEAGKRADIAIWDRNIYTIPTAQIKDIRCQMTLLDGEVVYQIDRKSAGVFDASQPP